MDFIIEDNRIYASAEDGNVVAEITFPAKDGIATIDHTFVADSLRGQGIAGKLMEAAVAKIQADGKSKNLAVISRSSVIPIGRAIAGSGAG